MPATESKWTGLSEMPSADLGEKKHGEVADSREKYGRRRSLARKKNAVLLGGVGHQGALLRGVGHCMSNIEIKPAPPLQSKNGEKDKKKTVCEKNARQGGVSVATKFLVRVKCPREQRNRGVEPKVPKQMTKSGQ